MITLRPHQVAAIQDEQRLRLNPLARNIMIVLPTGAGKSLTLAYYALQDYQAGRRCIVFAHRDVLILQLSEALCKMGVPHTFIASKRAVRDITNHNLKKFGDSYYDETSPIIVSSNPTFAARVKTGKLPPQFLASVYRWIQDECFPAGTKITTKRGSVNIEDVQLGDHVVCFDESKKEFVEREVVRLYKNEIHDMMCTIRLSPHHVVNCTLGHPFYTRRGWVKAYQLNANDEVLLHDTNSEMSHVSKSCFVRHILLKKEIRKNRSCILLRKMSKSLLFKNKFGDNGKNQSEVRIKKNDRKQPYEKRIISNKNVRHTEKNRASTKNKRWKWSTPNQSRVKTVFNVRSLWVSTPSNPINRKLGGNRLSSTLQNRLWSQKVKNSNRSGWFKPSIVREKRTRQQERQVSNWVRLESVSFYEPRNTGNTGDGFVYNIEVHEHHNYVANNILVHNCHHALKSSETWGTCLSSLPNAIGLGFTATPLRADKQGLGSHADGFFDAMSVTTTMWDLIVKGMLSPYKVFIPPTRVDRSKMKGNSNGDFTEASAAKETDRKEVTGDAVEHYLRVSPGKPAITFCINIKHARHVADEFNSRGIPSVAISSKDPIEKRDNAMRDFAEGRILNLVNVDLLGEGYDSPGIVTLIMLRPTQSYSLFKQQFGRILRTMEGKEYGIVLDHVGNVKYMMRQYGLENLHNDPEWSLDRETKRAKNDDGTKIDPWIICPNVECGFQYLEKEHGKTCPECGHSESRDETEARIREMQTVDGDLIELQVDAIDHLLAERARVDAPVDVFSRTVANLPTPARLGAVNKHAKRLHAQVQLRNAVQRWCSNTGRKTGWSVELVQREFSRVFGVHVLQAQTLGERKALELLERINGYVDR